MKVAIVFLLVALSCYFGDATKLKGKGTKVTKGPSTVHMIPQACLEKLLKVDVPATLEQLQNLLCKFMAGQANHNEELYREFLEELRIALKDTGCSLDQILGIENALENVGDEVGKIAEELGLQILKAVEGLPLVDVVLDTLCSLLGETLKTLSQTLGGLGLNLNLASGGLPLLGGLLG
ncbi:hypothetical protein GDO81_010543 [Engystomops pustulosus]|uniref:Secreted protein n=1 Tax=Engystomops pustulosus TaxID=76066 RepID=A0AAV7C0U1_ENGPU|nr:hypothetical protein GDO81_010543 [Engystomops pustulosus]